MQFCFLTPLAMLNQYVWLSISFFLLTTVGFGQASARTDSTVYVITESQAEFPGGFRALMAFMQKNVRYPTEAQKMGVNGKVFASFVIETDGSLTNIHVLKGIGYGCDEEAIRVIDAMPCWVPGKQSGKPLRVKYNLPVIFGIDHPTSKVR